MTKEEQYQDILTFWKTIKPFEQMKTDDDFDKLADVINAECVSKALTQKRLLTHLYSAYLNWLLACNKKD